MAATTDLTQLEEAVRQHALARMTSLAEAFCEGARSRCSRRTGELADSIGHEEEIDGDIVRARVYAAAPYARYQDEGTGLYGPAGDRIYPTSAKVLVFDGIGGTVFAASTAGAPGTHFWSDTVSDWPNIVASI